MNENRENTIKLLERHYTAWSNGDIDGVVACYADGCKFEDMALEAQFNGPEGVRSFVTLTFESIPDFKWNPRKFVIEGENCVCEWQMDGTLKGDLPGIPGTGKRFDVRGLSSLIVRNGKIVDNRDYWSLATLLRHVGHTTLLNSD